MDKSNVKVIPTRFVPSERNVKKNEHKIASIGIYNNIINVQRMVFYEKIQSNE